MLRAYLFLHAAPAFDTTDCFSLASFCAKLFLGWLLHCCFSTTLGQVLKGHEAESRVFLPPPPFPAKPPHQLRGLYSSEGGRGVLMIPAYRYHEQTINLASLSIRDGARRISAELAGGSWAGRSGIRLSPLDTATDTCPYIGATISRYWLHQSTDMDNVGVSYPCTSSPVDAFL